MDEVRFGTEACSRQRPSSPNRSIGQNHTEEGVGLVGLLCGVGVLRVLAKRAGLPLHQYFKVLKWTD